MALGGGTFIDQNKVMPGSYINFVSLAKASATLSERGVAAIALPLTWGPDNMVYSVSREDFLDNSMKILGYAYDAPQMKGLRDLFMSVKMAYLYNLASGGKKAENAFATAKYPGTRGNDITVVVRKNVDEPTHYDVLTLVDIKTIDTQTVANAGELVDNSMVIFKKGAELSETASAPLTGGTDGKADGTSHQAFLDQLEPFAINALGCAATDAVTTKLYATYTKRQREEVGKKFQLVAYKCAADYEGVVNLTTKAAEEEAGLVYWVTGIIASCAVNRSNLNKRYDGEYIPILLNKQSDLEEAVKKGEFVLHRVNSDVRVLYDNNSLITLSDTHGEIFKDNQTVRVMDQIANDIALIFNAKYLGNVPNDKAGRVALWSDIVQHHKKLENIRAIQNFDERDVTVSEGETKKAVVVTDKVIPTGTMAQLYMTVVME